MPIEVQCEGCASTIYVRDDLAGRSGSCRRCGSSLTIPALEDLPQGKPLGEASAEEMVQELRRRGRRSVLLLVDGDSPNPIGEDQLQSSQSRLRSIGADAFDQGQLAKVYERLADRCKQRHEARRSEEPDSEETLFDLKGDQLGMLLSDFKKKHHRRAPGSDRVAPLCSDEFPGQKNSDLLAEDWHTQAGIVHARTDLPEENASPSIAGLKSELVLYQFLDGRLFQISAFFAPDAFHVLNAALKKKFGEPIDSRPTPRSVRWWTMESTIELISGAIRPPTPTSLAYRHDDLLKEAARRKPDPLGDL